MKSFTILKQHSVGVAFFLLLYVLCSASVGAASSSPAIIVSSQTDKLYYTSGDTAIIRISIEIPRGFHLYGNPLGPGIGKPLTVTTTPSDEIKWISSKAIKPQKFQPEIGKWVWAYVDKADLFLEGIIKKKGDAQVKTDIIIDGLICQNSCIPVKSTHTIILDIRNGISQTKALQFDLVTKSKLRHSIPIPMANQSNEVQATPKKNESPQLNQFTRSEQRSVTPQWDYSPSEPKSQMNLWIAILMGFVAGLILNVMPCVLPVVGIKILSFSKVDKDNHIHALTHSSIFSAGILSVFLVLASLASFAHFSWGQQFQDPRFLIGIIAIVVVFSLGMFGLFMINLPTGISNVNNRRLHGYAGDFLNGIFATLLATPCSGPFLGGTLAWTLTQAPPVIFTIFISVGLGMAFPYILFSSNKAFLKLLPKPGPWMEHFKYLMGFFLLGVAVYLLMGLPANLIIGTVAFCVAIAFGVVLYTRIAPWGSSVKRHVAGVLLALLIVCVAGLVSFRVISNPENLEKTNSSQIKLEWTEFSPELLKEAHAKGQHVIVDFTASWCLNCQYNFITVLSSPEISQLIKDKKILALKADLTKPNPNAESLLHHLGSRSVPFFAVFPWDNPYEPTILRDIIHKKQVMKILNQLTDK